MAAFSNSEDPYQLSFTWRGVVVKSSVAAVDRLVRILDSFSAEQPAWSLAQLSSHLGLPKSTLHRFLVSLETHDILRRNPDDRLWRPGYRLLGWGELAERANGLSHLARPLMQEIAAETGEMVLLTVYSEQEAVCTDVIDARHSVRLALEIGTRRPVHAGASSKILAAYLPEAEVQRAIRDRGLPSLCANTITDEEELLAELARIRAQGYAQSIEETDPGAWGIATPIFDRGGEMVGAIGIAGPIQRYSPGLERHYVRLCREACQALSEQLGARPGEHVA
jgi:IclR family KDG regulon transcriptional repressor